MKKLLFLAFLGLVLWQCTPVKLPILGANQAPIPSFSLITQDSTTFTQANVAGKIYVADFFFTSCPTICPIMKKQMTRIYDKYSSNDEVVLVSHSIDPYHDTPKRLHSFAQKMEINTRKWTFLTGNRDSIFNLAKRYMSVVAEDSTAVGGIVHSGYFLLIDKQRHIRGAYDGTDEKSVTQLLADMDILLAE